MEQEKFFQLLSDFIDDEMDFDLLDDFERELENDFLNHFLNTFKKTVELCRRIEMRPVPKSLHYKIIQTIENYGKKPAKVKRTTRKKHFK